MDKEMQELLTYLKELVVMRGEFAQKHRFLAESVLLIIDRREASKASGVNGAELRTGADGAGQMG